MVAKRHFLPYSVVEGAKRRVVAAFSNGLPIYLSISGGKDSIVLADIVLGLIREGRIDPKQLRVIFVDEEAMFDSVIDIAKDWRKRFLAEGAAFDWYCIEVRHFNCFNSLTNDESFICWDSTVQENWVRQMPSFATTDHPMLRRGKDSYQEFLTRISRDGISMAGVRVSESIQRRKSFSQKFTNPEGTLFQPIFDWTDTDVWRYIRDHDLDFPETYLHLYQVGRTRPQMRISQFFSIDTARTLVSLSEFEPGLMERVSKREPNAYLAALYWDTEMFRSAGGSGEANHARNGEEGTDFRAKVFQTLSLPDFRPGGARAKDGRNARRNVLRYSERMTQTHWRTLYSILIGGDPKGRSQRAFMNEMAMTTRSEINRSLGV